SLADVFLSIRVEDPQGLGDVDSVWFQVYSSTSPVPYLNGELLDNGTEGDAVEEDSVFSACLNLEGKLKDPPVLFGIEAPSTISRASADNFLVSVRVMDPQGLGDIKSVYFNTTKPDGSPASGNPFEMFDDGTSGDIQPGDGIYSLTVSITPQNATGIYRFDFFAEDYSGGCLFRFQARDREGLRSNSVVEKVAEILEGSVCEPLTHFMTVVD
ncbi:unnamed protein product, partial [marine sediment metagenome]